MKPPEPTLWIINNTAPKYNYISRGTYIDDINSFFFGG